MLAGELDYFSFLRKIEYEIILCLSVLFRKVENTCSKNIVFYVVGIKLGLSLGRSYVCICVKGRFFNYLSLKKGIFHFKL